MHDAPVQLRLVVETVDFDAALAFYRDALGLPELAAFAGRGDARVAILDVRRATLELANPAQKRMIDRVEAADPARASAWPSRSPTRPAPPGGSRPQARRSSRSRSLGGRRRRGDHIADVADGHGAH